MPSVSLFTYYRKGIKTVALEIGNGWNKTSQKGTTYQSLSIKKEAAPLIASGNYYFMMCKVSSKSSPEAPDFSIIATLKEQDANAKAQNTGANVNQDPLR